MYGSHDPVEDRFGFIEKGIFRCSRPFERTGLVITVAAALFLAFGGYYVLYMSSLWFVEAQQSTDSARTFGYMYIGFLAAVVITAEIVCGIILYGDTFSYRADEKCFGFWSEKAHITKTDIFYDDVVMVRYAEKRLFGIWRRGYTVTVVTRSLGDVSFNYLFNKSIVNKTTQNTPFRIIEERMEVIQRRSAGI